MTIKNAKHREENIDSIETGDISKRQSPRHYFAVHCRDRKILDESLITSENRRTRIRLGQTTWYKATLPRRGWVKTE